MKKIFILFASVVCVVCSQQAQAQDFGLSFSYFLPKNGYFSTPISPFSLRGVGFDINRFMSLETGASLYRMSGLNVKDLPFESNGPIGGPSFTVFVPAELVFQLKGRRVEFDIKGGGFFFYGFAQKLNYGNLDRALQTYTGWDVVNSSFTFKNNPGFGYHAGAELTIPLLKQVNLSLETNYLVGQSKMPLTGSYSGGDLSGTNQKVEADFADAKLDFTGLEFSIGVFMTTGGGSRGKSKSRRR
jgi:hypothetical protein